MKIIKIFDENEQDTGYLGNNQKWWFDSSHPDSFELFDLDSFYSEVYFRNDHVNSNVVSNYVKFIKQYYKHLTNKDLISVFEAGCAGGWFTKEFIDNGIDITAIEGAKCGYDASIKRGVPLETIIHHDLRHEIQLNKKFDIACCTEVAEHIETPFSAQLVKTLTSHSDLVWFSFEEPDTNLAHYHHCNEQPAKFWINIFDFYNYGCLELPHEVIYECGYRAKFIFYNKSITTFNIK
jgi:hypothetical protein